MGQNGEQSAEIGANAPEVANNAPESPPRQGRARKSTGDVVLDGYYLAYQNALMAGDMKNIKEWGTLIQRREAALRGWSTKVERGEYVEEGASAAEGSGAGEWLDIGNLAPHADQIAKEAVDMVRSWGIQIPDKIMGFSPAAAVAQQIREHPEAVKKGLDWFNTRVRQIAGVPHGGGGAVAGGGNPMDPSTWPEAERRALGLA